jgi:hypothetical protein
MQARLTSRRTIHPAACRSSRLPPARARTGQSLRSPIVVSSTRGSARGGSARAGFHCRRSAGGVLWPFARARSDRTGPHAGFRHPVDNRVGRPTCEHDHGQQPTHRCDHHGTGRETQPNRAGYRPTPRNRAYRHDLQHRVEVNVLSPTCSRPNRLADVVATRSPVSARLACSSSSCRRRAMTPCLRRMVVPATGRYRWARSTSRSSCILDGFP